MASTVRCAKPTVGSRAEYYHRSRAAGRAGTPATRHRAVKRFVEWDYGCGGSRRQQTNAAQRVSAAFDCISIAHAVRQYARLSATALSTTDGGPASATASSHRSQRTYKSERFFVGKMEIKGRMDSKNNCLKSL